MTVKMEEMTLRDYFAAHIMGPLLAIPATAAAASKCGVSIAKFAASLSYDMADAMISERRLGSNGARD